MNYNLLYAILFSILSFGFFRLHKWWLKGRKENSDSESFTFAGAFKHWLIIIGLAIAAIVYFFKGLQ